MIEYILTIDNMQGLIDKLEPEVLKNGSMAITAKSSSIGKWGMARLWRSWMDKTADSMTARGITMPLYRKSDGTQYGYRDFNKYDAHELFTCHWLGVDKDGFRLSWAKTAHDNMRTADKGERFIAMLKHEAYCLERGIFIYTPRDSVFFKLKEKGGY